jgi:CRP-like cAMP-binding protein
MNLAATAPRRTARNAEMKPELLSLPASQNSRQNRLLAVLPEEALQRLLPQLEMIELSAGQVLYDSGVELQYVYFPTDSIITLLCPMESGAATEVAVVGNEGIVGVSLFMGGGTTMHRKVVQSAGHAFRIKCPALMAEFDLSGVVMRLLLRYVQSLITQMAQTVVCNRHHVLERQLCRWLLLRLDRVPGQKLAVTQDVIAGLLGVRREGITEAAGSLQHQGLISYSRGHIVVLDRGGLEARACECYAVVKRETERLLPDRLAI